MDYPGRVAAGGCVRICQQEVGGRFVSVRGHVGVAKLLLEKGAYIMATNDDGLTALHAASVLGQVEPVELLMEKGANIMAARKPG